MRKRAFRLLVLLPGILVIGLKSQNSFAAYAYEEIGPSYLGARSVAMGRAYVAIADDQDSLFLNPAGLAEIQQPMFGILPGTVEIADDPVRAYQTNKDALKKISLENLNVLAGKNLYGRAQLAPYMLLPFFGVGFVVDEQYALYNRNRSLPQLSVGIQRTKYIQAGGAFTFGGKGRIVRKAPRLSLGLAVKYAWRQGGVRRLEQTELIQLLNADALSLGYFIGEQKSGVGADLGALYVIPFKSGLNLRFGTAFTNIGDVSFGEETAPAPMEGNWSVGGAVQYKTGFWDLIASYEHSNLLDSLDQRKKAHLGLQLGLPIVKLYGGLNQTYFSYGAGFDIWAIQVLVAKYTQSLSSYANLEPNTRYLLKLEMGFSF